MCYNKTVSGRLIQQIVEEQTNALCMENYLFQTSMLYFRYIIVFTHKMKLMCKKLLFHIESCLVASVLCSPYGTC